jgi:hypothetical protein
MEVMGVKLVALATYCTWSHSPRQLSAGHKRAVVYTLGNERLCLVVLDLSRPYIPYILFLTKVGRTSASAVEC